MVRLASILWLAILLATAGATSCRRIATIPNPASEGPAFAEVSTPEILCTPDGYMVQRGCYYVIDGNGLWAPTERVSPAAGDVDPNDYQ